tara:strand:- start:40 stop:348 length:309 start_codon:yes stop_codon:yes gene_type:complete
MQILEYKLHAGSGDGMSCPTFIQEGGYWANPDNYTFIGVSPDPNEFHIPDTVTSLTLAELKTRQLAIHAKYPMRNPDPQISGNLTNAEVETEIDNWWAEVAE